MGLLTWWKDLTLCNAGQPTRLHDTTIRKTIFLNKIKKIEINVIEIHGLWNLRHIGPTDFYYFD